MKTLKLNYPKGVTVARVHFGKKHALVGRKEIHKLDGVDPKEITAVEFGAMVSSKGKGKSFHPLATQPKEWLKAESNGKPKATPKAKKDKGLTRSSVAAELVLGGKLTARQVQEAITEQFKGDAKADMVLVRSVIYRLNKAAKAKGQHVAAKASERRDSDPNFSKAAFIREHYIKGEHTSAEVAELLWKKFGGDKTKLRQRVYTAPYHLKKQGVKGGWAKAAPKAKAPKQAKAKAKKKVAKKKGKAK